MLTLLRAVIGAMLTLAGLCCAVYFGLWLGDFGKALAWTLLPCLLGGIIAPDPADIRLLRSDPDD